MRLRDTKLWLDSFPCRAGLWLAVAALSAFFVSAAGADVTAIAPTACPNGCDGVAVDSSGTLYLSDGRTGHRIVKVAPDGTIAGSFGSYGTGPGHFEAPNELAFNSAGNLLVSDYGGYAQEVTPAGAPVHTFAQGTSGITTDGTDTYALRGATVLKYDGNGALLATYAPPDLSVATYGIAYNPVNGDLYVADRNAGDILEITTSGTEVRSIGGLSNPDYVAVNASGDVFTVVRGATLQLAEFTSNGTPVGTYTGPATNAYQLAFSRNALYTASADIPGGAYQIDTATPIPSVTASIAQPQTGQTVTFDGSRSLLPFGQIVDYKWDLDGSGQFATDTGTTPTVSRPFTAPGATAISLRVTGSSGQSATTMIAVTTTASRAVITGPALAPAGKSVMFDALASALPASTIVDYKWDTTGSGSFTTDTGTTGTLPHTFSTPGPARIGVQVTRAGGVVNTAYTTTTVIPTPPHGNIGVSIDGGNYATNDPRVRVDLVWPLGATQTLLSNDGGFNASGATTTADLAAEIPWTLERTGADRLPKTVYVRFLGEGTDYVTFTDDIILDQTRPTLRSASLADPTQQAPARVMGAQAPRQKLHRYRLRLTGIDKLAGICAVNVSNRRAAGTRKSISNCHRKGIVHLRRLVSVRMKVRPRYVRVRNSAASWSRWLRLR
jgi:sugar lactone lactonase YvrE